MAIKILLADDSLTIQKVVELTFSDAETRLKSVGSGDRAVQALDDFQPDIVLADVVMPGLTGYDVCEAVKQRPGGAFVPVVLLTGTFEPFDRARAERVGSDAIVTKPFDSHALQELVRELVARAGAAREEAAAAPPVTPEPPPVTILSAVELEAAFPSAASPAPDTGATQVLTPLELDEAGPPPFVEAATAAPEGESIYSTMAMKIPTPAELEESARRDGILPSEEPLPWEASEPAPEAALVVEPALAPEPAASEPEPPAEEVVSPFGGPEEPPPTVFEPEPPPPPFFAAEPVAPPPPPPAFLEVGDEVVPPPPPPPPAFHEPEPVPPPFVAAEPVAPPPPAFSELEEAAAPPPTAWEPAPLEPEVEVFAPEAGPDTEPVRLPETEAASPEPFAAMAEAPAVEAEAAPFLVEAALPVEPPAAEAEAESEPEAGDAEAPAEALPVAFVGEEAAPESAVASEEESAEPFPEMDVVAPVEEEPVPWDEEPVGEIPPPPPDLAAGPPETEGAEPITRDLEADLAAFEASGRVRRRPEIWERHAALIGEEAPADIDLGAAPPPPAPELEPAGEEPLGSELEEIAAAARLEDLSKLIPPPSVSLPVPPAATEAPAATTGPIAPSAPAALSDADVDRIARRVVELLSDRVVRDIAWDVVPEFAERLVRERIAEVERAG